MRQKAEVISTFLLYSEEKEKEGCGPTSLLAPEERGLPSSLGQLAVLLRERELRP